VRPCQALTRSVWSEKLTHSQGEEEGELSLSLPPDSPPAVWSERVDHTDLVNSWHGLHVWSSIGPHVQFGPHVKPTVRGTIPADVDADGPPPDRLFERRHPASLFGRL